MIAKVLFRLPYKLHLADSSSWKPQQLIIDGVNVTIFPPQQFSHMEGLLPRFIEPPAPSTEIMYNGTATNEMDGIVLALQAETLDRSSPDGGINPTLALARKVLDQFLLTLRAKTLNPEIRVLDCPSLIMFLDESGNMLKSDGKGMIYGLRPNASLTLRNPVIDEQVWLSLGTTSSLLLHQELMLDAFAISPESAAVTLAFTAVEAATKLLIKTLASQVEPKSLGAWLSTKFREPRIQSLLEGVVAGLTGVNLKNEPQQWEDFQKLLAVRNSIVHDGTPLWNGKKLTEMETRQVIEGANRIILRLEDLAGIVRPVGRTGKLEFRKVMSTMGGGVTEIIFRAEDNEISTK